MRDVQHRLAALGFSVGEDPPGAYGEGTAAAVREFQDRRGLRVDGVCGDDTWAALVEAGYRLGDRPLYLTSPLQRGDDVAELQRRLGSLGFDAGRVDGIFGIRTDRALLDFQRNVGLVTDAICGPATLAGLARLGTSGNSPSSIATVREREQHRRRPHTLSGRTIAVGDTGGLEAVAAMVTGALAAAGGRTLLLQHPNASQQAAQTNSIDADAYVGLALSDGGTRCSTAYYRSASGWESPEGRRLAELVQASLVSMADVEDGGVVGMAVPVLRETRMPAIVAELGSPVAVVERSQAMARALTEALQQWVQPGVDA